MRGPVPYAYAFSAGMEVAFSCCVIVSQGFLVVGRERRRRG